MTTRKKLRLLEKNYKRKKKSLEAAIRARALKSLPKKGIFVLDLRPQSDRYIKIDAKVSDISFFEQSFIGASQAKDWNGDCGSLFANH